MAGTLTSGPNTNLPPSDEKPRNCFATPPIHSKALRTGVLGVHTNSSVFVQTPFGGYKQSGVGKELGMHALEHNTELKSVFISTE